MNLTYVIISENALSIACKSETRTFKYSDYNFAGADNKLIVKLLIKVLEENKENSKDLCLIPCDNYLTSSTECTEHYRNNGKIIGNEIDKVINNTYLLNGSGENDCTKYLKKPIQIFTEVFNSNQRVEKLSEIPPKNKYFLKTTKYQWKTKLLSYLTDELKYFGYNIRSIVPLALVGNYFFGGQSDKSVVLTYYENSTVVNIFENGILRRQKQVPIGFYSLIEKVSNHFNISFDNSKLIIEKYGYIFLPSKFTDFVIDIPVFEDIYREIELTELSFIIREEIKNITESLMSIIQNDNISITAYEKLVFNSNIHLPGLDKLLDLMTGIKSNNLDLKEMRYGELSDIKNIIVCGAQDTSEDILEKADFEPENLKYVKEECESFPNMLHKIKCYLNSNFRQGLAEI